MTPTKTPLSLDEFDWQDVFKHIEKQGFVRDSSYVASQVAARYQHSKDKAVIQELRADYRAQSEAYSKAADLRLNQLRDYAHEIQTLKAENERLRTGIQKAVSQSGKLLERWEQTGAENSISYAIVEEIFNNARETLTDVAGTKREAE